jgi:hypothetical protein
VDGGVKTVSQADGFLWHVLQNTHGLLLPRTGDNWPSSKAIYIRGRKGKETANPHTCCSTAEGCMEPWGAALGQMQQVAHTVSSWGGAQ